MLAKALTQEVITDFWECVKQGGMNFIQFNQEKLKLKAYNTLVSSLKNQGQPTGNKVILPLITFIGGPHAMAQLYQDSMAICKKYGAPSLFITMTANLHWPEILAEIPLGNAAYNHPTVTARVF